MKVFLLSLFMFFFAGAAAQSEVVYYLNDLFSEVRKGDHSYYQVIKNPNTAGITHEQTTYYQSGSVYSKGIFSAKDEPTGIWEFYYPNGNLKEKIYYERVPAGYYASYYEDGHMRLEGSVIKTSKNLFPENVRIKSYWDPKQKQLVREGNGTIAVISEDAVMEGPIKNGVKDSIWYGSSKVHNIDFAEVYRDGEFVSGISVDSTDATHKYSTIMTQAGLKNGFKDFYSYLAKNVKFPQNLKSRAQVIITFVIGTDGKILRYNVGREDHPGLGEIVAKAASNYFEWIPYVYRGVSMPKKYTIPIYIYSPYEIEQKNFEFELDPSRRGQVIPHPILSGNRPDYRR